MARLKPDPILRPDLDEFLETYSDFGFELSVLRLLRSLGLSCEHGGLYEDPVTRKPREFDIRALKTLDRYRIRLAVECKNIRENFPLLVCCTHRHESESYHQVAVISEPDPLPLTPPAFQSRAKVFNLTSPYTIYPSGEPVGKSTVQIGRALDGSLVTNDSEVHEKWGQAISSAADLVSAIYWEAPSDESGGVRALLLSTVIPFVVVPDGRLWAVTYADDGLRTGDPAPTERCSCFIGKDFEMGSKVAGANILLSHLEIVTETGMRQFVEKHLVSLAGMEEILSRAGVAEALRRQGAG